MPSKARKELDARNKDRAELHCLIAAKEREQNPIASCMRACVDAADAKEIQFLDGAAQEQETFAAGTPDYHRSSLASLKSLLGKVRSCREPQRSDTVTANVIIESVAPNMPIPEEPKSTVTVKVTPSAPKMFESLARQSLEGTGILFSREPKSRYDKEDVKAFTTVTFGVKPEASEKDRDQLSTALKLVIEVGKKALRDKVDIAFKFDGNKLVVHFFSREKRIDPTADMVKSIAENFFRNENHPITNDVASVFDHATARFEFAQDIGEKFGESESLMSLLDGLRVIAEVRARREFKRHVYFDLMRKLLDDRLSENKLVDIFAGLLAMNLPSAAQLRIGLNTPEFAAGQIHRAACKRIRDGEVNETVYLVDPPYNAFGTTAIEECMARFLTSIVPLGLRGETLKLSGWLALLIAARHPERTQGVVPLTFAAAKILNGIAAVEAHGPVLSVHASMTGFNIFQHVPADFDTVVDEMCLRYQVAQMQEKQLEGRTGSEHGSEHGSGRGSGSDNDDEEMKPRRGRYADSDNEEDEASSVPFYNEVKAYFVRLKKLGCDDVVDKAFLREGQYPVSGVNKRRREESAAFDILSCTGGTGRNVPFKIEQQVAPRRGTSRIAVVNRGGVEDQAVEFIEQVFPGTKTRMERAEERRGHYDMYTIRVGKSQNHGRPLEVYFVPGEISTKLFCQLLAGCEAVLVLTGKDVSPLLTNEAQDFALFKISTPIFAASIGEDALPVDEARKTIGPFFLETSNWKVEAERLGTPTADASKALFERVRGLCPAAAEGKSAWDYCYAY